MVQGVGDDATCHNVTIGNVTSLEMGEMVPIFSVSNYFRIIFVFLAFSSVAFILINCLDLDRHRHNKAENNQIDTDTIENDETSNKLLEKLEKEDNTANKKVKQEKFILYTLNFLITFFFYGVLPGLQSFSTIPYGKIQNKKCKPITKIIRF